MREYTYNHCYYEYLSSIVGATDHDSREGSHNDNSSGACDVHSERPFHQSTSVAMSYSESSGEAIIAQERPATNNNKRHSCHSRMFETECGGALYERAKNAVLSEPLVERRHPHNRRATNNKIQHLFPGKEVETTKEECFNFMDLAERRPDPPGEEASTTTSSQALAQQQLLCIHICPDMQCTASSPCRPFGLTKQKPDLQTYIKYPTFFYVSVALVLQREREMRHAARVANIPKNRWNGSLLYRKWKEIEQTQQQPKRGSKSRKNKRPPIIPLHPVQAMAQAHVVCETFRWWQSWLTVCIRSYYNTGTLRIPHNCHGFEILLALEYFGIIYDGPNQLVFDEPAVYPKVKQWSSYFGLRSILAQWVVEELQRQSNAHSTGVSQPFVFCTHPEKLKPGWCLCLGGPPQRPTVVLGGGLFHTTTVHDFFVPSNDAMDPDTGDYPIHCSTDVLRGMMREDFLSYLQHVLPGAEISFQLQHVQLVPPKQPYGQGKRKLPKLSLRTAVLVIAHPPCQQEKGLKTISGENSILDDLPAGTSSFLPENEQSSLISADSTNSSQSAPTDEMAYARLMNSAHEVLSRLRNQCTEEKSNGDFFFPNLEQPLPNKLHQTVASNGSLSDSHLAEPDEVKPSKKPFSTKSRQRDAAKAAKQGNAKPAKRKGEAQRAGLTSTYKDNPHLVSPLHQAKLERDPAAPPTQKKEPTVDKNAWDRRQETNRFGYQVPVPSPSASKFLDFRAQGDHIYEDLYQESLGLPAHCLQKSPTGDSLLWTPSLIYEDIESNPQPDVPAPLFFVNAEQHDHVSVTSSITRQADSAVGSKWKANFQKSQQPLDCTLNEGNSNEQKKEVPDRQSSKNSCGAVQGIFGNCAAYDDGETSSARKLHDESFQARFDALLNENEIKEPNEIAHELKSERIMKERLQAALEDLKLGICQGSLEADLHKIRAAAVTAQDGPCQFLKDIYELFAPRHSAVVPPVDGSQPRQTSIRSTDSTTMLYSTPSTKESRSSRVNNAEAVGITEENVQTAAIVLRVSASASTVGATDAAKENLSNAPTAPRARKFVIPKLCQITDEEDAAAKNGIEVYHVPAESYSSESETTAAPERAFPTKQPLQTFLKGNLNRAAGVEHPRQKSKPGKKGKRWFHLKRLNY